MTGMDELIKDFYYLQIPGQTFFIMHMIRVDSMSEGLDLQL